MKTYAVISVIMLVAGVLGGFVNYLLAKPDETPPPNKVRSVVVGTAAALLVPLFLNMIGSNLLDGMKGPEPQPFVLLGFCLVAAISSTAFIRSLSDRVLAEAKQAKQEAKEAKESAQQIDQMVELLEDGAHLPGSRGAVGVAAPNVAALGFAAEDRDWNADPHKGNFGGSPEANGRVLEATITPAAGPKSAACKVLLRVRSTNSAKPLNGNVTFYLHPTFEQWQRYDVPVTGGIAEDTITSWGRFTVGAVADGGDTRLELDLATVPGGTTKFYSQ